MRSPVGTEPPQRSSGHWSSASSSALSLWKSSRAVAPPAEVATVAEVDLPAVAVAGVVAAEAPVEAALAVVGNPSQKQNKGFSSHIAKTLSASRSRKGAFFYYSKWTSILFISPTRYASTRGKPTALFNSLRLQVMSASLTRVALDGLV